MGRGAFAEAAALCEQVLREAPGSGHALFLLGNARARSGDLAGAVAALQKARIGAPRNVLVLNSLGGAHAALGALTEARAVLEQAVELDPQFPWALQNLGSVMHSLGSPHIAKELFERAVAVKPDFVDAIASLADIAEMHNDPEKAETLAKQALSLAPGHVQAQFVLARLAMGRKDYEAAALILENVRRGDPKANSDGAALRARVYDALGRFDDAFAAYEESNAVTRAQNAPRYETMVGPQSFETIARLQEFTPRADIASWRWPEKPTGAEPVFLIGFPRSGTTLLEQVLASHPDVAALEEHETLVDAYGPLLLEPGALDRWGAMSGDEVNRYRGLYWQRVETPFGRPLHEKVFVDKMPLNTIFLPLLYRLFPNAKYIFALRDPRDVIVSCFTQSFKMNPAMFQFLRLDTGVRYYDEVMRLGDTARQALPLNVHELKYEDLVSDFDATAAKLLTFLDLPWTDQVREFVATAKSRQVLTPSAVQVRQPLYASSMGKWRRYEKHLAPYRDVLDRWAARFGYEV